MNSVDSVAVPFLMLIPMLFWLGALAFIFVMVLRLVRAVERIANILEQKPRSGA